jgi:crossover junction endodeoxyribonuclease RuvC
MMTAMLAGLDLSLSNTGIAVWNGENVYTKLCPSKPLATGPLIAKKGGKMVKSETYGDKMRRFDRIRTEIDMWIPAGIPVFLEGPSYASAGQATHDIAGNWWLALTMLEQRGNAVNVIAPSVLKKYATGSGNAAKDVVMAAAIKRYPDVDVVNNDVADATVLLAIGLRLAGIPLEDSLPATHLKALETLQLS